MEGNAEPEEYLVVHNFEAGGEGELTLEKGKIVLVYKVNYFDHKRLLFNGVFHFLP